MPSGSGARRLLVLAGFGLLALLLAGAVMGVIGQKILGLGDGYVSKPEIHLPPQPVFPAAVRDKHLGLTAAEQPGGEPQKDGAHAEEAHSTPLPITQFAVTNTLLSSWVVTAVLIQRQTGGDLAEVLDKIGGVIRERIELFGLVRGLTAEGRLSGWVLFALPFVVFAAVMYMNPDYGRQLLEEPRGKIMLMVAGGMQLMGLAMIRWIVNIKV